MRHSDRRAMVPLRPALLGSVLSLMIGSVAGLAGGFQGKDVRDGGTVTRPAYSGRVVRAFDFEEQYTNPLPVPRGWIRAQHDPEVPRDRPGFPIWNGAVLDYTSPAYSGTGSVYLPTGGGSTSLILRHGELTVFPSADYMVSARVRTDGLSHARARLVTTLIDRAGNEILGATASSTMVQTRGEWDLVSVFIEGTEPTAAFVRVELQLLQPEQQPRARRVKPFTVWSQDFEGGAWFDDVVVAQVPMIGLTTGTPGNVVVGDEAPTLEMTVRDLTGDDLSSVIRVFDASGVLVDGHDGGGMTGKKSGGEGQGGNTWVPDLPGFGWYHAVLDVSSGSGLVGRQELDFIWAPPRFRGELAGGFGAKRLVPEESAFGLRATSKDAHLLESLPDLVLMAGVKHVEMLAWDAESVATDFIKGAGLVDAVDRLIGGGVVVGMSLSEVPMELADQAAIDHDAIFGLLINHQPIALPVLGPFLDRYGQQVTDWRVGIGAIEDDGALIRDEVDAVVEMMDPYVPGAVVGVGWAMDRPFEPETLTGTMRLIVEDDASFPDEAMMDLVGQWVDAGGGSSNRLSVVHRPHGAGQSGNQGREESVWSRVGWLGRRAINSWWAGKLLSPGNDGIEIVLSDPWTVEPGRRGRVMPGPELLVWRTLVDHLGGRDAVEEIDLEPGVRMLLCSGRDGSAESSDGALVVWLDEASLGSSVVELPLSTGGVEVVDLFGNVTAVGLDYQTDLDLPMHRIEVTRTPRIVTGVNPELVRFLANLRLTPDRLEATSGIHKHELVVTNPWPFSIRGRVYLVEPGGYSEPGGTGVDRSWEIKPRVVNFTITAGMEERFELDVSYSAAKLAGMKDLVFDVELTADQDYGLMRVEREIELGSDLIDVDLSYRRVEPGADTGEDEPARGRRVIVDALVTNRSGERIYADLVAIAPKNARQESTISVIEPMDSGRRSFMFRGLDTGDEVIIMVRVPGYSLQINKSVALP